jgi:arsenate reductase
MVARVLILCTGNSCRSQMAEAILRDLGQGQIEAFSAGTRPWPIMPMTIRALDEIGLDIRGARSKGIPEFLGQPFDVVVTVCDDAREACPVWPGDGRTIHVPFDDPAAATGTEAERLAVYRRVRDEIAAWARAFVPELLDEAQAAPR